MQNKVPWFKRLLFGSKTRIEIYEMLGLLLENNVLLIDALREIRGVMNTPSLTDKLRGMSEDDPKIRGGNGSDDVIIGNVTAEAIHDWIMKLKGGDAEGTALANAVRAWVPQEEFALIQAGEATGDLRSAFADAIEGIQNKNAMIGAVVGGTVYPAALFIAAFFVERLMATKVVPRFAQQMSPDTWEGPALWFYLLAEGFNRFAIPATIALIVLLVIIFATLPYFRGPIRVFLDRTLPPWSMYRMIQGSTFLRNIAVQTRAGIKLYDSVSNMSATSPPWMRERLEAALYGIRQGLNLGEALHNAEYQFPDKRSVQILRVLASRDGFDQTVYRFAKEWQKQTVIKVKKASAVFLIAAVLTMGGVAGITLLGIQGISAMIEESADQATSGASGR